MVPFFGKDTKKSYNHKLFCKKKLLALLSLGVTGPHAQLAAVEAVFGIDDVVELRSRYHIEHFVMVVLLNLFQLHVHFVALLDGLAAAFLVGGLNPSLLALAFINGTQLLVHLVEDREERCRLLRCQTGLTGDKLLHLNAELLRREPCRLLSLVVLGPKCHSCQ